MKIGVPKEFFSEGVNEKVSKLLRRNIDKFEKMGARCEECSLPTLQYSLPTYYLIAMSEASSNLARYDGVRYGYNIDDTSIDWSTIFSKNRRIGFGAEVKRRIILGTYALSSGYYDMYYLKALKVRTLIKKDFERVKRLGFKVIGDRLVADVFGVKFQFIHPSSAHGTLIEMVQAHRIEGENWIPIPPQ